MSVWYCIPSKRPEAQSTIGLWRERGYRLALFIDAGDPRPEADLVLQGAYPGYAKAVNSLCAEVIERDVEASWLVTGGDDVCPDPTHEPGKIALECTCHFANMRSPFPGDPLKPVPYNQPSFGVMQPTGDRWGSDPKQPNFCGGAYADRVCSSPWMGREFCQRMYGGRGPLFEGYFHMFEDEELMHVAKQRGVLWQRPDLTQLHRHWGRTGKMPEFLRKANSAEHWEESRALFESRKRLGFLGHEPLGLLD